MNIVISPYLARGYSALISVLILSGILLIGSIGVLTEVAYERDSLSDGESYKRAVHATYTCGHAALRMLGMDSARFSHVPVQIYVEANRTCSITRVTLEGNSTSITVQAHDNDSYAFLDIRAERASNTVPFIVTQWKEGYK